MKKLAIFLTAAVITFFLFWFFRKSASKITPPVENTSVELIRPTSEFSTRVNKAMESYLAMKDAFVEFDTAAVKRHAADFILLLDSLPMEELKKDSDNVMESALTVREDIKKNMQSLLRSGNITDMRKDFSAASDMIYPGFLQLVNYSGERLYLQHCPMAFYDTLGANWISNSEEIMNPYLGRFHPKYKSGMLHCGEVLDSTRSH